MCLPVCDREKMGLGNVSVLSQLFQSKSKTNRGNKELKT